MGTVTGLILACIVTAQFFLFLEFPFKLVFPVYLLIVMYILALSTTYYAVNNPIQKVNKQNVAVTIKGSGE